CLNNYEQAHLYLEEAINLNPRKPVAYFICGEIYFRQNRYDEAIDNLKNSLEYKAKLSNLYTILGNSCLLFNDFYDATRNYNIALKNDPNNYLCLKNCAYSYEKQGDYLNALKILDKLLSINKEDSLLLKLQSSDSNSLATFQLFHLEYLLNKNTSSSKDLNNILTKINQIPNISENKLLLLIRCKIHIELIKYYEAKVDLDMLFELSSKFINEYCYYRAFSFIHLLQKHSDFWSYLCKVCEIDKCDFTKLGIINEFSKYMYKIFKL
ncbi:TPR-like protein, partial [Rhizophagus irregularis]